MAEWPKADGMRLLPVLLGAIVGCIASTSLRAGDLAPLGWLAGCWSNPQGEPGSGEYWQPLAGGTMLGIGRLVREGRTRPRSSPATSPMAARRSRIPRLSC